MREFFLYRDHRGSLADSLETVQEMSSFKQLQEHIFKTMGPGEITIKPYGYDKRVDWETFIVCHNGNAMGFCNSDVKK